MQENVANVDLEGYGGSLTFELQGFETFWECSKSRSFHMSIGKIWRNLKVRRRAQKNRDGAGGKVFFFFAKVKEVDDIVWST